MGVLRFPLLDKITGKLNPAVLPDLSGSYVPAARQVNGHALTGDVTLGAGDVSAVPTTRTVNGKPLSDNVTLAASDVGAVPSQSLTRFGLGPTVSVGKTRGFDFYTGDYASPDLAVAAAIATLPSGGFTGTGGEVVLGPGTWDFVGGVDLSALKNVRIRGAGMATQVRWKNGNTFASTAAGVNFLFVLGAYCTLSHIQLVGQSTFACTINGATTFNPGSGSNTLGGGLKITDARTWLETVYVTGMAEDGINNQGGIGTKYSNVQVIGCGGTGLNITNVLGGSGNYATDGDLSSVWIGSCGTGLACTGSGSWISGAHVWGCQNDGVTLTGDAIRFLGGYSENNGGSGIRLNNASRCIVSGCDVWANAQNNTTASGILGGVRLDSSRFCVITGNQLRDNRIHAVVANVGATDNLVQGNEQTDTYRNNLSAGTTISYTASGTQTTTTDFVDNNAPAWMASPAKAIGVSVSIVGAGTAGATLTSIVSGWVSATQVTLETAQITATTNPTYGVSATKYGFREVNSGSTRNKIVNNNFKQVLTAAVLINSQASGQMSYSFGNSGQDEPAWNEAGNVSGAVTVSPQSGTRWHATVTGNITSLAISGSAYTPLKGAELELTFTQDATGGRTISGWPSSFKWKGAAPLTSLAAGAEDKFWFVYDGTNWQEKGRSIGDSLDRFARKASDQTVTNSTTLVADADLTLPVYPGEVLTVEGILLVDSTQTADVKVQLSGPTGATGTVEFLGPAGSTTSTTAASINPAGAVSLGTNYVPGTLGSGLLTPILVRGTVVVGSTAGNLALSFAQQTAEATNTIIKTNSRLAVVRRA